MIHLLLTYNGYNLTFDWLTCSLTYQLSNTLNNKEVEMPPSKRPPNKTQKCLVNFIKQQTAYKTQNTKVNFFLPNLSASGPVKVPRNLNVKKIQICISIIVRLPNVELDPNPVRNNRAEIINQKSTIHPPLVAKIREINI